MIPDAHVPAAFFNLAIGDAIIEYTQFLAMPQNAFVWLAQYSHKLQFK